MRKKHSSPDWKKIPIKRDSILTMGNGGIGLAETTRQFKQPPISMLLDKRTNPELLKSMIDRKPWANIFLYDLASRKLNSRDIKTLTLNSDGDDLTNPNVYGGDWDHQLGWIMYYRELTENVLDQKPNKIYSPFGTGVLFSTLEYSLSNRADGVQSEINGYERIEREFGVPGIGIPGYIRWEQAKRRLAKIGKIEIYGAEPAVYPSAAGSLSAPWKPSREGVAANLRYWQEKKPLLSKKSGIEDLSEVELIEGSRILQQEGSPHGIQTGVSGAAGASLALKHFREGKIPRNNKVVVINTGTD